MGDNGMNGGCDEAFSWDGKKDVSGTGHWALSPIRRPATYLLLELT